MSGKSIISNSYLDDIGDAIRYKKGTDETFYPSQMGDAIRSIEGIVPVGSIEIDTNGTYNVTEKAEAVVSVQPDLRPLSVSENGTYQPDDFDGYSDVTVDVEPSLESLSVTENGLYLPESGTDGFDRVSVAVPAPEPVLQGKAVNPSETAQHITADTGYDGLSAVDVGAIPSSYVGTGITRRSGSDLTASGGTVSVPSGYYAESGSKSVQSGTAGTPTASKSAVSNHSIAVTPSVSNTEGYISGGTLTGNAVTVSASELVSGTENITANGTYDVVNKASAVVNVPSQAPVLDSLSVTQNGTYTPTSGVDGFDEVVVNVPTGGGGGLTLLDTIEVNGVRGVQVDIDSTWFNDADYVLLVPELTFSASDWLYVIADATSGGNAYADKRTSAVPSQAVFISRAVGTISVTWLNGRQVAGYMSPSYLYWYMYYASTTMTGTIKVYGIKVS